MMGYNLTPRNKKIERVSVGSFSWPIILEETGAGYVLGYGKGLVPASYVYQDGNNGSPVSNDGYIVNAFEAKAIAKCMNGYISVQKFVNEQYEKYSDQEKDNMKKHSFYRKEVSKDFLDKIRKIADFIDKSGGFRIY